MKQITKGSKVKKLIVALAMFASATAQAKTGEAIISERVVKLNVLVSDETVKFSSAGYSMPVVKVLIPSLADVTLLDHRNPGESAPCMAAIDQTIRPDDVIKNYPGVVPTDLKITLTKILAADEKEQTCRVFLMEQVEGRIRGFLFYHSRDIPVGNRHIDDCR